MNRNSERTASTHESENSRRKGHELFHDGELGRCPECGRLIMLPCLACRLKERDKESNEQPNEFGLALELRGLEEVRYRQVRIYRETYGISWFEDELRAERILEVLRSS